MKSINHLSELVYKLIEKKQVNSESARDDFLEKESVVVFPNMNEAAVDIVDELLPSAVSRDNDKQDFTHEELAAIKLKTSGPTAFAGTLFRKLFSLEEMKGRNCRGVGGKERLNEKKIQQIQECVFKYYPDTQVKLTKIWARCIQTIDSYIRNKHFNKKYCK